MTQGAHHYREAVISNGQRALHLQRVQVAVEVSDLAATSSAYFDATAHVGRSDELESLVPQMEKFASLIARLRERPTETQPYRTLIPAEVWTRGTAHLADLEHVDVNITDALAGVGRGEHNPEQLTSLAAQLLQLSNAFAELGRQELDALTHQPSSLA